MNDGRIYQRVSSYEFRWFRCRDDSPSLAVVQSELRKEVSSRRKNRGQVEAGPRVSLEVASPPAIFFGMWILKSFHGGLIGYETLAVFWSLTMTDAICVHSWFIRPCTCSLEQGSNARFLSHFDISRRVIATKIMSKLRTFISIFLWLKNGL